MVFPLGDDNSDRTSFPAVNVCSMAANVLVFGILQGFGTNESFTMGYSAVSAEIISRKEIATEDRQIQVQSVDGPAVMMVPGLQPTPIPVLSVHSLKISTESQTQHYFALSRRSLP